MPAPKLSLKARALRYLSMRERSRMELRSAENYRVMQKTAMMLKHF